MARSWPGLRNGQHLADKQQALSRRCGNLVMILSEGLEFRFAKGCREAMVGGLEAGSSRTALSPEQSTLHKMCGAVPKDS